MVQFDRFKAYMKQLLEAADSMHQRFMIHRDIKARASTCGCNSEAW